MAAATPTVAPRLDGGTRRGVGSVGPGATTRATGTTVAVSPRSRGTAAGNPISKAGKGPSSSRAATSFRAVAPTPVAAVSPRGSAHRRGDRALAPANEGRRTPP